MGRLKQLEAAHDALQDDADNEFKEQLAARFGQAKRDISQCQPLTTQIANARGALARAEARRDKALEAAMLARAHFDEADADAQRYSAELRELEVKVASEFPSSGHDPAQQATLLKTSLQGMPKLLGGSLQDESHQDFKSCQSLFSNVAGAIDRIVATADAAVPSVEQPSRAQGAAEPSADGAMGATEVADSHMEDDEFFRQVRRRCRGKQMSVASADPYGSPSLE